MPEAPHAFSEFPVAATKEETVVDLEVIPIPLVVEQEFGDLIQQVLPNRILLDETFSDEPKDPGIPTDSGSGPG